MHTPRDYAAVFGARNRVIRGLCFDVLRGPPRSLLLGHLVVNRANPVMGAMKDESLEGSLKHIGPRLGLIVPKRLARKAVLRNTIKRQAREAFRLCNKKILPAVDLVLRLTRWPQEVATLVSTPLLLKRLLRQEIEDLLLKVQLPPDVVAIEKSQRS